MWLSVLLVLSLVVFAHGTRIRDMSVYKYDTEAIEERPLTRQLHPIIMGRRSLRQMSGQPISGEDLLTLFDAARWAPSLYNMQPWRFVYATRGSPHWARFLDALLPGNQRWARNAAVLMVVLSRKAQMRNGELMPVPTHSFDTGAAFMAMALEGTARGLVVHPAAGYDWDKVVQAIALPDEQQYEVEAMVAIGHRAHSGSRENTTQRNEIDKFVSEGYFVEKQ